MGKEYTGDVYVIQATKSGRTEYWAAAVPHDKAIEAVDDRLAPGWNLVLIERRLAPGKVTALRMRANSVRLLRFVP
jgi:hypothetical protein